MGAVNEELFERMPVPKAVKKLMVPTIAGSLVMVLYSLADTLFVGMLNDELQSAAVALAAPALMAFNAVNNLFGIGTSSMMSRALGAKDSDTVRKSAAFGFYGSVFSGLLMAVLAYLFLNPLMRVLGATEDTLAATRAYMNWAVVLGAVPSILNVVMGYLIRSEGAAFHASIGTMSGCFLNMILDPIFILPWGLNLGAAGAGAATFVSNCVACLYFLILLKVKKQNTNIRLNFKYFTLEKRIFEGICGVGVPAAIQNILNVTGMAVLNNFVKDYGPAAVAAVGIAQKINMVPLQIALGGTQGVMPLISYSYAGKNKGRMKECILYVVKLMLPCMTAVSLTCWLFAGPLVQMFIQSSDVVAYGILFLRGFCVALPFMLMDFLAVGVFQGVGKGKNSLVFAILRKIILEIPAIILLNSLFHAAGITYAGFVAEVVLSVAGVILLRKIII